MTPETGTLEVDHALAPVGEVTPAPPVDDDTGTGRRVDWVSVGRSTGRFVLAILGALALFGVFMWAKGVNPFGAYQKMFSSTFTSWKDWGEILIRSAPVILAALAVCVPARAGPRQPVLRRRTTGTVGGKSAARSQRSQWRGELSARTHPGPDAFSPS